MHIRSTIKLAYYFIVVINTIFIIIIQIRILLIKNKINIDFYSNITKIEYGA